MSELDEFCNENASRIERLEEDLAELRREFNRFIDEVSNLVKTRIDARDDE